MMKLFICQNAKIADAPKLLFWTDINRIRDILIIDDDDHDEDDDVMTVHFSQKVIYRILINNAQWNWQTTKWYWWLWWWWFDNNDNAVSDDGDGDGDRIGLLPDTENCRFRMHREYRGRFPRHRLQRKPLVSDPGIHHVTCVTHVSWYMSGSLTSNGGENVPGIPGSCAIRNFTYLARDPYTATGRHLKQW